jgi:pimeloyl-ACP methyl ester carboxylesterase
MQSKVDEVVKINKGLIGNWHHHTARKRLIIICHGYQGSGKSPTIATITNGLNRLGHDTFTFDFSRNIGGFDIEHQVKDIAQIVEYFNSYEEIILLAFSFAALTTAIATIHLSKVKGLTTVNGFFGRRYLRRKHFKSYAKFRIAALIIPKYRRILKYFQRELQPDRIKVPVLVIHSRADTYVYIKQSQIFYGLVTSPKHYVELETANHDVTSSADRQIVISHVHEWVTKLNEPS